MHIDRALQIHRNATCLYDENEVEQGIAALADKVAKDYQGQFPLLLCVMNGGLYLTGQLLRYWEFPLTADYVHATRYRLATLDKDVLWKAYPQNDIMDRHVSIIDDIFDQGFTLEEVTEYCKRHGAKSCKSIFLIQKTHDRRTANVSPDYVGLECSDCYVYGAGMDLNNHFRNLSSIYYLDEKVTE